ncbi:acetylornithine deacetylase [Achromobacter xylosoxidans]|uniref:acetylornithine deacetylase n=1 Tax=Alcaligenes xylosoxydans xylosoxydans TaxID=85698 RepID=UPI00064DC074|nr:acetylornithine deacetylase [Achromobacter xylosoxidans]KMJ90613.1 acetylornithine deacetylase [Achromobacter xylosoxidans]
MALPLLDGLHATLSWLGRLVACETVSGTASNLPLLGMVEEALRGLGFRIRYTYSPDGRRANLYASHGGDVGGILLSGHTDVVPVAGQEWSRAPFELSREGERVYGRGVCDMKGFLACVLSVLERLDLKALKRPVHVAFTFDEEIGCIGVRSLLEDLRGLGIRPDACVVGEPTGMAVVRAHKGRHALRCRVLGRAAHSSLSGLGVNAAQVACALVAEITEQAGQLAQREVDEDFYVPFSTMAVCRVHAGQAANVIPESAEFDFDLRFLPGVDPDAVLAPIHARAAELQRRMRDKVEASRVDVFRRTAVPALVSRRDEDGIVARLFQAGAGKGSHVAFTTEAGLYQAAGIPTVVCGPGDIAQAHTADEFIAVEQLALCEGVLARLLAQ